MTQSQIAHTFPSSGSPKKSASKASPEQVGGSRASTALETLLHGLRHLGQDHREGPRDALSSQQTQRLLELASQNQLLVTETERYQEPLDSPRLAVGTEHIVQLDRATKRVHKLTKPPFFGIIGGLCPRHVPANPRTGTSATTSLHFDLIDATPLEYLERWTINNQVFADQVEVEHVIAWPNKTASIVISQPQYHGELARLDDILHFFALGGWAEMKRQTEHLIFYHPEHDVIATADLDAYDLG